MSDNTFTRRQAIGSGGALIASTAFVQLHSSDSKPGTQGNSPARIAPLLEIVDVPEFKEAASLRLPGPVFATIAGGDRQAFDRITLRPRMLIPTLNLDLSLDLFGEKLFAPILIGPVSDQKRFHPDGELATVRGAVAAKAVMVVSSRSSVPIGQIVAQSTTPLWYQVFAETDAKNYVQQAAKAGCKAICITVGATTGADGKVMAARTDWAVVDHLCQGISVPVLIKGIITPEDAKLAVQHGAQGIVVSNYGGLLASAKPAPIERVSLIVDAVQKKVPVLLDGSIQRGSDIFKALALGAQGVLVSRPAMWGLAAYGADGVQKIVELLQSELARSMGMCGRQNLQAFDRSNVKIHTR